MMKRFGTVLVVGCLMASVAFGTALTANRDTHTRTGELVSMLVETNVTIYAGAMVCENGSSRVVPASDTSGYAVIGRAESAVSTVGDLTATKYINVRRGVFLWANGDSFTAANVGDLAYVEDDQTVQKAASATYDIVAGIVIEVVSGGVWVDTYAIGGQGAASVTTLSASGAANLQSTLAVAGVATFTAESVHNGGIDTDYVTVDAAAGIDTKTAGTLKVGESTATKVEIADTAVSTDVEGPLVAKEDIQSDELDAETATTLLIGKATATAVTIGASDITTAIAGPLTAPRVTPVTEATTTRICTSADYGKTIMVTTNAAVAITLPANGAAAGSWIEVMTGAGATDSCAPTIAAATTDTLVGPNDPDLKSVTWGTGHRIGAQARFISDGSFWHVRNLGGTTMTYTD